MRVTLFKLQALMIIHHLKSSNRFFVNYWFARKLSIRMIMRIAFQTIRQFLQSHQLDPMYSALSAIH